MFSFFSKGVKDNISNRFMDFKDLVDYIKSNPKKDYIESIRSTRLDGNMNYKDMKKYLPNITPNCLVKCKSLTEKTFHSNFISLSKYLYFDIDNVEDIESYKKYLIDKFKDQASLICTSTSGKGISVFFRVDSGLKDINYKPTWRYIRDTYLKSEDVDENASNLGRIWFITSDTSLFYNYENNIVIPNNILSESSTPYETNKKECIKVIKVKNSIGVTDMFQQTNNEDTISTPNTEADSNPYKDIVWETPIKVLNPILDYKDVVICKLYIPKLIKDGKKRTTFIRIINNIVKLNSGISLDLVLQFMHSVNTKNTSVPMVHKELIRLVQYEYQNISERGTKYATTKVKKMTFNKDSNLSRLDKVKIASKLRGMNQKNNTITAINEAVDLLIENNIKITKVNISKVSGLSYKTVCRNYFESISDIDAIVSTINSGQYLSF